MEEFLRRNFGLISNDTQKKIKKTKILLIGCGLGSQIAISAARKGFKNFILCDGDKVELSNLNRQAFDIKDVGVNKAKAIKKKILTINPHCKVEVYPKFVKHQKEVEMLIKKSDIVVNMADPNEVIYIINAEARKQNKYVLFPFTFGFGGFALVFSPQSATIEDIVGGKVYGDECFAMLIMNSIKRMPDPFKNKLNFVKTYQQIIKDNGFVPQLGVSASITSSIIVGAIIKLIEGVPIPLTPDSILIDPWG
ncbi:MAG: ThiF family adenylyltransferase [bacterium]|nr:ThiF family adenylyltransferase [bacterium]